MSARRSGSEGGFIWHLRVLPEVLEVVARQPEPARLAFKELVDALRQSPRARELGVITLKSMPAPNLFSAPIGENGKYGILTYQIYADHPAIHLFHVVFWQAIGS